MIFSVNLAWDIPLKGIRVIAITNVFQKILLDTNRKLNKIWVDKCSKFYNKSVKSWLQDNDISTYSMHNKRKCVVAEPTKKLLKP